MAIHILIAVQQQVAADVGLDLFALGDRAAQIGIPAGLDGERLARIDRGFLVAEGGEVGAAGDG
jgi:hypothetical protein